MLTYILLGCLKKLGQSVLRKPYGFAVKTHINFGLACFCLINNNLRFLIFFFHKID